ncbi:MAG: hypothetical protein Aurels2KO_13560 [Aureliella sp.]
MQSRTFVAFHGLVLLLIACISQFGERRAAANDLPQVQVTDIRVAFDDGNHNAFTDMIRYRDQYWLTFRTCPDGHMVHPTSEVVVLRSMDGDTWKEATRFSVPNRDVRDPHFAILGERLFVYSGTWYCGTTSPKPEEYDLNRHLGYAVFTDDAVKWSGPTMLEGTYGHYIWRAASYGGRMYLCGRRKIEFDQRNRKDTTVQSAMLVSDDGLRFTTQGLYQETSGDETAFLFSSDGSVLGVSRRGRGNAQLVQSKPPYKKWDRSELPEYIGGPLLSRWAGQLVVGGRCNTPAGPKTHLFWLVDGKLHRIAELPSGGDNSYPGLVPISETQALVSWYSSHEPKADGSRNTSIYLAKLTLSDAPQRQKFLYESSFDQTQQELFMTVPKGCRAVDEQAALKLARQSLQPMVVSLHSWSGDLNQEHRELQKLAADRGWFFLQPNFRGVNDHPLACGSDAAVQDILDATDWATDKFPIDPDRIYLTGNSGGGHMTMLVSAKHPTRWTAASAWVGISDLAAWHDRHKDGKYGAMLRQCVGGAPGDSDAVDRELRNRSPIHHLSEIDTLPLDIAAGIHDGHSGSVPIRQSLAAFNRIAIAVGARPVSSTEIELLSQKNGRLSSPSENDEVFDPTFGRNIYLRRTAANSRISIFEGGHEGIASAAMAWFELHPRRE